MIKARKATLFSLQKILCSFLFLCPFSLSADLKTAVTEQPAKKEVWLTIFVHGIMSIKPHITVSNFLRFLTDNVTDSVYYHTVQLMRDDPFFYQNQAMQGRGLLPIDINKSAPGAAPSFIAQVFEYMNQHIYKKNSPKNYYYTYGWSGLLSKNQRYSDSLQFYRELQQEVKKFRARGIEPKIRMLGYSHGGKIILNLAEVQKKEAVDKSLHIDEVLFLGMPIQCSDVEEINNPIFKKIYNIFSGGDRIQKLDFFSAGQFFSDRRFKAKRQQELPSKLIQVEIKVIRKKGEGLLPLSAPCDKALLYDGDYCSRNIRNVSPGHTELWFFGWTPLHYRKTFPLFPLPIVTFTPYILNIINSVHEDFCPCHPIKIIVDPRRSVIILENKFCTGDIFKTKFLSNAEFTALRDKALSFYPINFNSQAYNEHIEKAYVRAEYLATHKKCNDLSKKIGHESEKPFFFEAFEQ